MTAAIRRSLDEVIHLDSWMLSPPILDLTDALLGTLPPPLDRAMFLRHMLLSAYMARAATTTDVFNAVAEPQRRELLDALAGGERPVNDLVGAMRLSQPQVSKHLRVLREVGAVDVRRDGRQRLYRLNGHALKPIHDWVKTHERAWSERLDQLDVVLEDLKREERPDFGA